MNQPGGAEKVVEVFLDVFPGAPVYTSVFDPENMPPRWRRVDVRTSFMQRISPRLAVAKALVPLYPAAFESFRFDEYDLVLSSTTTFAKGVITPPRTFHACYCNNPTRFLWMYHDYLEYERLPVGARALLPWLATPLRVWDYAAAQRPDHYIAGSFNAAMRIKKFYRRDSEVLQPPIDVASYNLSQQVDDYFLVVARLQSYKRIDLAVQACSRLGLRLHVVGEGPDYARLRGLAGPTVTFLGRLDESDLREQLARCRALVQPGVEDFGLTPLEAQASGRPVVAYGAGGALETVRPGETGLFFNEQTVECLAATLQAFEDHQFDPASLRAGAMNFDVAVFKSRLQELLARRYREYIESVG